MPSIRAHLLSIMVKGMRVRRTWDGAERIERAVAADRKKGPTRPPRALVARMSVREAEFDGRRVYIVGPRTGDGHRQVLYLHGGGWSISITDPHWQLIAKLVQRLGCTVTVPMYPLAPEHTAEGVFAYLLPLYADLVNRWGAGALTVMGDSSGGNVALSLVLQARARGLPQPGRIVLLSPFLDATLTDPRIAELDRTDSIITARGLRAFADRYAGGLDPGDPIVSPLFGNLDGLAPVAVFTSTSEILNADAHLLRQAASRAGFPLTWHEYPGMLHVWPLFPIPEADRAIDQMVEFITGGPRESLTAHEDSAGRP
ncbi:alpha/beta hydrolase fold domain-containing protein [Nocardia sp. NPDC052566]|uniref:alpha/beta hydrolase fold domain-containing protein n=1 Tax=Nocardia sp. NPDC052566 TaxID=3364330 RepID=UPI0037CC2388